MDDAVLVQFQQPLDQLCAKSLKAVLGPADVG